MPTPLERIRRSIVDLNGYQANGPRAGVLLDANESPHPPPKSFYDELCARLQAHGLNRYPDSIAAAVRQGLAQRLGGEPEQYILGNGSDENILLLPALFESAPVAYLDPSFAMYRIAALTHGHKPLPVPLQGDFSLDAGVCKNLLKTHRPSVFFIASPNNPTNNTFDPAMLTSLVSAAPDTLFVIDEAYGPYNEWSAHRIFQAGPNVAVLGTLSKIGLAGLRLGWIRLSESLAEHLNKLRAPYNTSVPAQLGAELLLTDYWDDVHRKVDSVIAERTRLEHALLEKGYRFTESRSNSLLVNCLGSAKSARESLLEHAVHVRWFSHTSLTEHFRVSIGSSEDNDAFLAALPQLDGC